MTKLEGWKANCLSKAGRTVLIQSHLESLSAHTMQCFTLPLKTNTTLNNLARDFFWKKSNTQKGLPLISWDHICQPKSRGGLGLRKAEATKKAFQYKLAWKIFPNSLSCWVQTMQTKYLPTLHFWTIKSNPLTRQSRRVYCAARNCLPRVSFGR